MRLRALCTLAALLLALPAEAAVVVTLGGNADGTNGLFSAVPGARTVDFDGATALPGIGYFSDRGALSLVTGNVSGRYKAPNRDSSRYLTVGSFGPEKVTIQLTGKTTYFGFYWGSPDAYNRIRFFDDDVEVAAFNGKSIPGFAGDAYVNFHFTGGDSFNRILLASATPAFETDNHAFGPSVPLPATSLLMASALFMLARWRRRS